MIIVIVIVMLLMVVLALLSQVMQHYFLNMMKTLRFGGKEVKEEDIVKWLNDKITSSPSIITTPRQRITSFKDTSLSTCHVFIDLLNTLRPGCINPDLVQRGDTREHCCMFFLLLLFYHYYIYYYLKFSLVALFLLC